MNERQLLSPAQRDVLQEVANIGAGHAATALSTLVGQRVLVRVPRVIVAPFHEARMLLGDERDTAATVRMRLLGDLLGQTLLVMREIDAQNLCDHVLKRPVGTCRVLGELEQSSLKEVGNILAGAYLNAVAELMRMTLLPSVPHLMTHPMHALVGLLRESAASPNDVVLSVETAFHIGEGGPTPVGHFLLCPEPPALSAIFDALKRPPGGPLPQG